MYLKKPIAYRKLIITALGLITIAYVFYVGRDDLSVAPKRNGHMIGQWQVVCPPQSANDAIANKLCYLSHAHKDSDGKLHVIYHIGFDNIHKLKFVSFIFFNDQINLNTLTDFKIENDDKTLSFVSSANYCNEQGCQALMDIDEHILNDIISRKDFKLCVTDVDNVKAFYPLEIYGLEHAFKLIKSQISNK